MGARSGEGTRSAIVGHLDSRRVQLRLTGGMLAVAKFGRKRDVGFENRRPSVVRRRVVGQQWDLLPTWWKYALQAGVTMCREEQFLRAYRNKHTKAELNDCWIPCSALFILKWLRGIPRGSYQNEDLASVLCVQSGRRALTYAGMTLSGRKKGSCGCLGSLFETLENR